MADAGFEKEFLDTHNAYRKKHGSPPMTLSRDLCISAQAWADKWIQTKNEEEPHSDGNDYGENVYTMETTEAGKEAVDFWYSEIKDYDFSNPGYNDEIGHFSQVVWKESNELGVGVANDREMYIVVGQYKPPGNSDKPEHFEENVTQAGLI